jgi:hypothetical protein
MSLRAAGGHEKDFVSRPACFESMGRLRLWRRVMGNLEKCWRDVAQGPPDASLSRARITMRSRRCMPTIQTIAVE